MRPSACSARLLAQGRAVLVYGGGQGGGHEFLVAFRVDEQCFLCMRHEAPLHQDGRVLDGAQHGVAGALDAAVNHGDSFLDGERAFHRL